MVQLLDSGISIPTVVVLLSGFVVEVILLRQLCIFSLAHPIFYDIALTVAAIQQKS